MAEMWECFERLEALEERLKGGVQERFGKAGRRVVEENREEGEVDEADAVDGDEIKAKKFCFVFSFYYKYLQLSFI